MEIVQQQFKKLEKELLDKWGDQISARQKTILRHKLFLAQIDTLANLKSFSPSDDTKKDFHVFVTISELKARLFKQCRDWSSPSLFNIEKVDAQKIILLGSLSSIAEKKPSHSGVKLRKAHCKNLEEIQKRSKRQSIFIQCWEAILAQPQWHNASIQAKKNLALRIALAKDGLENLSQTSLQGFDKRLTNKVIKAIKEECATDWNLWEKIHKKNV